MDYVPFKTLVFFLLFLPLSSNSLFAQKNRAENSPWYMNVGFGYFQPPGLADGNILYAELGYQLESGYNMGLGFGLGDAFATYEKENVLFAGYRSYHNLYVYRIFINRPFRFGTNNNHLIRIGSGIIVIQPRYVEFKSRFKPIFDDQGNIVGKQLIINPLITDSNSIEAGIPLTFEYGYSFGPLVVGVRLETHLLYAIGIDDYIIAPQVSLDF